MLICLVTLMAGHSPAGEPLAVAGYRDHLPTGQVDWGNGLVQARGQYPEDGITPASNGEAGAGLKAAERSAQQALQATLMRMNLSSEETVGQALARNPSARASLAQIAGTARVVDRRCFSDGSVELTCALGMRGGFLQLVMPQAVASVSTVQRLGPEKAARASACTGLVIDARGLGVRPAVCPRVLSEDGVEVYGPSAVSREAAVQEGMAAYVASPPGGGTGRAGPRPICVRGLRAAGRLGSDIVISAVDAAQIRSAPESVVFLRRCRVVVVLD
jgi:hypothetical protein